MTVSILPARSSASPPLMSRPSSATPFSASVAASCALPRRDHHRRRHREAHRARTGDDQHGDARRERTHDAAAGEEPDNERHDRDHEDHRHKNGAHAVRQSLNRRPSALRLSHERDNARQRALLA